MLTRNSQTSRAHRSEALPLRMARTKYRQAIKGIETTQPCRTAEGRCRVPWIQASIRIWNFHVARQFGKKISWDTHRMRWLQNKNRSVWFSHCPFEYSSVVKRGAQDKLQIAPFGFIDQSTFGVIPWIYWSHPATGRTTTDHRGIGMDTDIRCCEPMGMDVVNQWIWMLWTNGYGCCEPMDMDVVNQWIWMLWTNGYGCCEPMDVKTCGFMHFGLPLR